MDKNSYYTDPELEHTRIIVRLPIKVGRVLVSVLELITLGYIRERLNINDEEHEDLQRAMREIKGRLPRE